MRILMLNVLQNRGSTGQLVTSLSMYLEKRGHNVVYCYRDGGATDGNRYYKIGRRFETALTRRLNYIFGIPYGGAYLSTLRLLRIIKRERIDVICMHSINASYVNVYMLLHMLKKWDIPVVFTHHSEYLYTGSCTHAVDCNKWKMGCRECTKQKEYYLSRFWDSSAFSYKRMKRAFDGLQRCTAIAVSDWVLCRAKQSSIMANIPHVTIENGIDDEIFYPRSVERLRAEYGLGEEKVVFFSTAYFTEREEDNKGGRYIIELAKLLQNDGVKVLVAALSCDIKKEYENIIFVGSITKPQKLAELYSLSDVLVIASKRETFSMPTAEAMMCGTPVAGFYAGGPETIALPEYSIFCEYGDTHSLYMNVMKLLKMDFDRGQIAHAAQRRYSKEVMCQKYCELIERANIRK